MRRERKERRKEGELKKGERSESDCKRDKGDPGGIPINAVTRLDPFTLSLSLSLSLSTCMYVTIEGIGRLPTSNSYTRSQLLCPPQSKSYHIQP